MAIEIIEDVLQRPLSRLPMQFRDKEGIEDLLSIFVEELFELQDVFSDINGTLDLDVVEEYWLDRIGIILNESRSGDDDETYRKRLQMKVFFNKSEGTEEFVTEAIKFLTGGENVKLTDAGFANLTAVTDGSNLDQEAVDDLKRLLAATVILTLEATFDGTLFVTVDPDPFGDTDFVNPDSGLIDYSYYDSPDAGKWFQDYEELTTADITIDTAVVGEKHSVMINSNFVENESSAADVDVAALELAALIDALDGVSASSSLDTITVTGTGFTLAAISQNTTMNPAWLSTYGGVLTDVVDRTFDATDTSSGWSAGEGVSQVDHASQLGTFPPIVDTFAFTPAYNPFDGVLYISRLEKNFSSQPLTQVIYEYRDGVYNSISSNFPGQTDVVNLAVNPSSEGVLAFHGTGGAGTDFYTYSSGSWTLSPTLPPDDAILSMSVHGDTNDIYVATINNIGPVYNLYVSSGGTGSFVPIAGFPGTHPGSLSVDQETGDLFVADVSFAGGGVYSYNGSVWKTEFPGDPNLSLGVIEVGNGGDAFISTININVQEVYVLRKGSSVLKKIPTQPLFDYPIYISVDSTNNDLYGGDLKNDLTAGTGEVYKIPDRSDYWTLHATFEADHIAFSPGGIQDIDDYLYMTRTSDNEVYRQNLSTGVVSQWGTFPGNVPGKISFRGTNEGVYIAEASPTDALSDRVHSITDNGGGPSETSADGFPSAAIMADVTESQFSLISNAADPADSVLKWGGVSAIVQGSYPGSAPERLVSGGYDNQHMYVTEGNIVYKTDDKFTTSTAITISEITGIADVALDQSTGDVYIVDDSATPSVYLLYKGFGTSFMRLGEPLPSTCIDIEIDQQTGDLWVNTSAGIYLHKVHQYQKYRTETHNLTNHQLSGLHWNSKGDTYAIAIDDADSIVKLYVREFGTSTFVQDTTVPLPEPTSSLTGRIAVSTINDDVFLGIHDTANSEFFIYRKFGGAGDWILEGGIDSQKYIVSLCVDQQTGDFYYLSLNLIYPGADTGVFVKPLGSTSYSKKASLPTFPGGTPPSAVNVNDGSVYVSGPVVEDVSCSVIPSGSSSYQSITPYINQGWVGLNTIVSGINPGGDLIWGAGSITARSGSNYLEIRRWVVYSGLAGGWYNDTNGETYTSGVAGELFIFNDN